MDDEILENIVTNYIDDKGDFEELLELFGLTPQEVFVTIYYAGLLDDNLLDSLRSL
jgi:hypothetical protein